MLKTNQILITIITIVLFCSCAKEESVELAPFEEEYHNFFDPDSKRAMEVSRGGGTTVYHFYDTLELLAPVELTVWSVRESTHPTDSIEHMYHPIRDNSMLCKETYGGQPPYLNLMHTDTSYSSRILGYLRVDYFKERIYSLYNVDGEMIDSLVCDYRTSIGEQSIIFPISGTSYKIQDIYYVPLEGVELKYIQIEPDTRYRPILAGSNFIHFDQDFNNTFYFTGLEQHYVAADTVFEL